MKEILTTIFTTILVFFTGNNQEIEYKQDEYIVVKQNEVKEEIIEDIKPERTYISTNTVLSTPLSSTSNYWSYPSDIKETTRNGNDLLVLVNKSYKLPSTYAPSDLTNLSSTGIINGSNYYLRSILINDLKSLVTDAKADGISLSVVSAYRSYSTQVSTYNYWVQYNGGSVDAADKISARAGHSQHQLGTAIDFSSPEVNNQLGVLFNNTKASAWLKENSYKYGFVISFPLGYESTTGFNYESWHYRYIGKANALEMKNSGMILEIYLRSKN